MEAPGQLLKHYAPYLPCYFFCGSQISETLRTKESGKEIKMSGSAFISFSKKIYSEYEKHFKYYFEVGTSES